MGPADKLEKLLVEIRDELRSLNARQAEADRLDAEAYERSELRRALYTSMLAGLVRGWANSLPSDIAESVRQIADTIAEESTHG